MLCRVLLKILHYILTYGYSYTYRIQKTTIHRKRTEVYWGTSPTTLWKRKGKWIIQYYTHICSNLLAMFLLANSLSSSVSFRVSKALLMALIPMGRKLLSGPQAGMSGFPELMMVMHTLAGAGNGAGHLDLFQAATSWLQIW